MERIGIVAKPAEPKLRKLLPELCAWIKERGCDPYVDEDLAPYVTADTIHLLPKLRIPSLVELILVLGGDGTLLSAARLPEAHKVPILGVNLGSLGFLTEVSLPDIYPTLRRVLDEQFCLDKRMMLRTSVSRKGKKIGRFCNLNEIAINKGALGRIISLEIHINGAYVNTFLADGLIISTPTGSSAYNLSAGGPIIHPSMEALVLTPICPHTLTNRPIVIPGNLRVSIKLISEDSDVYLTCDGQEGFYLEYQDAVVVTKSEHTIKLIQPFNKDYYYVLRSKLNWGVR